MPQHNLYKVGGMSLKEIIIPGIPDKQNGHITFFGENPTGEGFEHIFSFVFYIYPDVVFEETKYYIGMKAYVDMLHNIENPFPFPCGMIIYTNPSTVEYLLRTFPLGKYPKLTVAVVEWPFYTSPAGGGIDTNILRTLRFQAIDHYPLKYVHMRDADTIFVLKINEGPVFTKLIYDWEQKYLEFIPLMEEKGYQIVMGTHYTYLGQYHTNIPYPVDFSFPVRIKPKAKYGVHDIDRERHLYLESEELTDNDKRILYDMYNALRLKDYDGKFFQDYLNRIIDGQNPVNYEIHTKTLEHLAELKEIANSLKATGRIISPYETPEQKVLIERREQIGKRMENELKEHRIRTKQTLPISFYEYFEKQYLFKPYIGIFAGFVSVFKNRVGIENFWRQCVEYLLPRYRWVLNRERNAIVLSDQIIKGNTNNGPALGFGKDERMLMFGVTPRFLDKIFFFPITYITTSDPRVNMSFFTPEVYFTKIKLNKRKNYNSPDKAFERQSKAYAKWIEDIHTKYPKEDDYLNAINANVEKLLISHSNLPEFTSDKEPLHPYKALALANYKATLRRRGGGKRKTRRKH